MQTRRLTRISMLATIALTIFIVELQIPAPVPIPGVKLGLANIVTVYGIFLLGPADTMYILIARILLGAIFSGRATALFYSLAGGLLCYVFMLFMRKLVSRRQIWICSIGGAIAHNIGQISVAILITGTPRLIYYLPLLMISAIITGLFTGLCAQFIINRKIPQENR